ncbi:respiratory nitrate reductase subunit gamma [Thiofilum flexile]|uniref:respiratory nitrate reductase subunit gamma n=1 Tax=Thiofilum flexile TaxID=125627 RepID=UPI00037D01D6|nr:respiratory nitrate reductase subunit gamma [Thiofilum flexile]
MSYFDAIFFGLYPYVAGTVFLLGSWLRYDHAQYTWRAGSSQMLNKTHMRKASNLFHVGILVIFFGHLVGLLTPHWVYEPFMSAGTKQVLAIMVGGIAGIACWYGALLLFLRRMNDPRVRATGSTMDLVIIGILLVQVTLGLLTIIPTLGHLDGSNMLKLAEWAQAIVFFKGGAAAHLADVGIIFKLHIVLGLTIFLLFPFTRLVHIWSVPLQYVNRRYQIVRARG